jgi:hypothetical protein
MKKTLITIIGILAAALCILVALYRGKANENERLSDNQHALLTDLASYRTKDSLSVASVERLTLSNSEFRKYNEDLKKTVDELNLKVRQLQSVSQTAVETKYVVNTVIRDSIIYVDHQPDTLRCIDYEDAYLTFAGCEKQGIFTGHIESRDSLITIVHRVPRKFLFIRWGTKAIRQEVLSRNPYSTITCTEYLELKK